MSERETMNVAETNAVQEAEIALDELVEISTNLFETYWVKIGHGYLAGRTYCMRINRVNRPRGRWYIASYSQFIKTIHVCILSGSAVVSISHGVHHEPNRNSEKFQERFELVRQPF